MSDDFRGRIEELQRRVDIVGVIGAHVALGRGRKPRGKCPFHGSKSDSLAVDPDKQRARCFGCGWSGDAIKFVRDFFSLSFVEAMAKLEGEHGLDGLEAAPVRRERAPVQRRREAEVPFIAPIEMGRWLWRRARCEPDKARTYLRGRGVPEAVLGDHRLQLLRFHGLAPIMGWPAGADGKADPPADWPKAPALVALIQAPVREFGFGGLLTWQPIGVHVTFLSPDLASKMVRERRDGRLLPARKMLGAAGGGAVLLPGTSSSQAWIETGCPLYVGEGIETVLSGMAIAAAGGEATGLATLSLGTLQGEPKRWRNGAVPLYDPQPDPERPPLAFGHSGPVTGLIDADMKPLRGPVDRATGEPSGELVAEARGVKPVRREISTAERAELCAGLFVHAWRNAGCRRVTAMRPPMGQDFNDAVRGQAA